MACKRAAAARTPEGRPQKRAKTNTQNQYREIKAKPAYSWPKPESKGAESFKSDAKTLLDEYDSDATDYDTNATISERLWISDAEDDDDEPWKNEDVRRIEQQPHWHSSPVTDTPGSTENRSHRSPSACGSPLLDKYDENDHMCSTSIASPGQDDFFSKWYWDDSWYDAQDSGSQSQVSVEPPPSLLDDELLCQELPPWSAPPEPFRPVHPYVRGLTLDIRRHEASPPFYQDITITLDESSSVGDLPRVPASNRELRATTVVELCLNYPPLAGKTHTEEPPRRLTVVETIRAKDGDGAQLVVCRLDDDNDDNDKKEYVAKIYDPFYYGFADPYWKATPWDVATEVDRAYCAEVAAYTELEKLGLGGKEVSKYYGSWTFQLPVDSACGGPADGAAHQVMRDVRMILTEHHGTTAKSMAKVRTDLLPEAEKLATVRMMMEASARISGSGIYLGGDISPESVVVCGLDERVASRWSSSSSSPPRRVVLVDLSRATVRRLEGGEGGRVGHGAVLAEEEEEEGRQHRRKRLPSPIRDWWDRLYDDYGTWLPAGWEFRLKPMQEWLWRTYKDSDEYQTVEKTSLRWADEDEKAAHACVMAKTQQ